jgi:hypothetical protein
MLKELLCRAFEIECVNAILLNYGEIYFRFEHMPYDYGDLSL